MTRDETVALFLQCEEKRAAAKAGGADDDAAHEAAKAHWNAWAEKMLAERKALEALGRWAAKDDDGTLQPQNDATRDWMARAPADFSRCLFLVKGSDDTKVTTSKAKKKREASEPPIKTLSIESDRVDFEGFLFPGDASFESASFACAASFENANFLGAVSFGSAIFSGPAAFDGANFMDKVTFGDIFGSTSFFLGRAGFGSARFTGPADFQAVCFSGPAWFSQAEFTSPVVFSHAIFTKGADFVSATFMGNAWFSSAIFKDHASFSSARCTRSAFFDSAAFMDRAQFNNANFADHALFTSATFKNATSFNDAKFRDDASFIAIKVERAFDMTGAEFTRVPAFNQANFTEGPDLDDVRVPLPWVLWRGNREHIAKYRALKRMAIKGADYEREQMFAKGELRSRRFTEDHALRPGVWLGLLYDVVADCGRSIFRPFAAWLAAVYGFAWFYQTRGLAAAVKACADGGQEPWTQALFLSGKNALVVLGGVRDARVTQAYTCLYGGAPEQPAIPSAVSFAEAFAQTPISAALIFLFLLAVKNRFKIK